MTTGEGWRRSTSDDELAASGATDWNRSRTVARSPWRAVPDATSRGGGRLEVATEWTNMRISRVVPHISAGELSASRASYRDFLGLEVGMDLG